MMSLRVVTLSSSHSVYVNTFFSLFLSIDFLITGFLNRNDKITLYNLMCRLLPVAC